MTPEEHARQSAETLAAVRRMEDALAAESNDMAAHFHEDFLWRGNAGSGTKRSLAEFRRNWQLPFRAAFTDRDYRTEHFMADGEWAACFGYIEATHSGPFMGVPPTGKRVRIPYMDFWKVIDGRIADNPVSVDLAHVLRQLGVDPFHGQGWERFDAGEDAPAPREPVDDGGAMGWDASAAAWIEHIRADRDATRRDILDAPMLDAAQAAYDAGARSAVDIGCGEGRFCRMLSGKGWTTTGIEPTAALRDAAQSEHPSGTYLDAVAEALPLEDASADLCVFYLSLIDIAEPDDAIAEATRVLRSGGTLLVSTLTPWATARPAWLGPDGSSRTPWGWAMDDYLTPRSMRVRWAGIDIDNHHRPLSQVMAPFLSNGLVLTALDEPPYRGTDETEAENWARAPWAFMMQWKKP